MPGRLTAYERGDMVLLGKIGLQNSHSPATASPGRGPSTARDMTMRKILLTGVAAIGIAVVGWVAPASLQAQQAVTIDNDDIGGVVTGPKGPEAGLWVIAE